MREYHDLISKLKEPEMAQEQKPFVIYTTENFEMTSLLKELEEKKVEIIYLKELLEKKEEEIENLKAANAKLEKWSQESVKRRKMVNSISEDTEDAPTSSIKKMDVQTKEPTGKEIKSTSSNQGIKLHLPQDISASFNSDISTRRSQKYRFENVNITPPIIQASPLHSNKVTRNTLIHVHDRYQRVLNVVIKEGCSNRQAYKIAGIPRSTVRDMIGIAELQIVDKYQYETILKEMKRTSSVKNIETACRKKLGEFKKKMKLLRAEGKLLPIVFNDEFYYAEPRKRK